MKVENSIDGCLEQSITGLFLLLDTLRNFPEYNLLERQVNALNNIKSGIDNILRAEESARRIK